jgi:hypothetical protein
MCVTDVKRTIPRFFNASVPQRVAQTGTPGPAAFTLR